MAISPVDIHPIPITRSNISQNFSDKRAKGSWRKDAEKEKEVHKIPMRERGRLNSRAIRGRRG